MTQKLCATSKTAQQPILCPEPIKTQFFANVSQINCWSTQSPLHLSGCKNDMLLTISAVQSRGWKESFSIRESFLQEEHRQRTVKSQIQQKILSREAVIQATFQDTSPKISRVASVLPTTLFLRCSLVERTMNFRELSRRVNICAHSFCTVAEKRTEQFHSLSLSFASSSEPLSISIALPPEPPTTDSSFNFLQLQLLIREVSFPSNERCLDRFHVHSQLCQSYVFSLDVERLLLHTVGQGTSPSRLATSHLLFQTHSLTSKVGHVFREGWIFSQSICCRTSFE